MVYTISKSSVNLWFLTVTAGDKASRLSINNHSAETIHHHHAMVDLPQFSHCSADTQNPFLFLCLTRNILTKLKAFDNTLFVY